MKKKHTETMAIMDLACLFTIKGLSLNSCLYRSGNGFAFSPPNTKWARDPGGNGFDISQTAWYKQSNWIWWNSSAPAEGNCWPITLFWPCYSTNLCGSAFVYAWFKTYLAVWSQFGWVNGISSTRSDLMYSVPLGSILGCILHLLYCLLSVKL